MLVHSRAFLIVALSLCGISGRLQTHASADESGLRHNLQGTGHVEFAAFSPDGTMLVSREYGRTIRIWDAATGKERELRGKIAMDMASGLQSRRQNPGDDQRRGCDNSTPGRRHGQRAACPPGAYRPCPCDCLPSGWKNAGAMASSSCGPRTVARRMQRLPATTIASPLVWTARPSLWEAGRTRSSCGTWPEKNSATFKTYEEVPKGYSIATTCAAFSPNSKMLATGQFEGSIQFWGIASGKKTASIEAHNDRTNCVAFSPDGKLVASSSWGDPPSKRSNCGT